MGGFCSAWCLWFVEIYIRNIYLIKNDDLKTLFNKIIKKLINSKYTITEQIRNYSNYLHKKQNEFLLNNHFEYAKLYNNKFNKDDLEFILNLISTSIENILTE